MKNYKPKENQKIQKKKGQHSDIDTALHRVKNGMPVRKATEMAGRAESKLRKKSNVRTLI